ncbi:MAG: PepSY domain-containing protein [Rubripirellula sp.]
MSKITSRKMHRWLSVLIGIQLLLWTVSGLIFSWNPISQIRGEDNIKQPVKVDLKEYELVDIHSILGQPDLIPPEQSVIGLELKSILGRPFFDLKLDGRFKKHVLVDGITGEVSSPISRVEAEAIAIDDFAHPAKVLESTFIDQVQDGHSEYRSKEVPVWKVLLDHPSQTAIYVSAQRGEVVARRNARWRVFDFFWMLHTMDYQGRDNFNSLLLQVMAISGVVSVLSGYWLWIGMHRKKIKEFIKQWMP